MDSNAYIVLMDVDEDNNVNHPLTDRPAKAPLPQGSLAGGAHILGAHGIREAFGLVSIT